jgi:hypothetical protein
LKCLCLFALVFFTSSTTQAFVLLLPNYKLSNPEDTVVYISSQSECDNFSNEALGEKIEVALERYWNRVQGSSLELRYGGISNLAMDVAAPSGTIVVGCATSTSAGFASPSVAFGSAQVVLRRGASYEAEGREGIIRILAHELGHAIGLHHSDDPTSIMTYRTDRPWRLSPAYLSQDDKNGVIYLYPEDKKLGGLGGGCGMINTNSPSPPKGGPIILAMLFILYTLTIFKKRKFS